MTRKATLEDIGQLSELFDQYRIFYHKDSDIPGAEKFLTERMENKDSRIFVAERKAKGNWSDSYSFIPCFLRPE